MAIEITIETIGIFAAFIIIVFLLSRLFKILIRIVGIAISGFSFPWIVEYLNIGLPITADVATGLQFAIIAVGLYIAFEFFHIILAVLGIVLAPFKLLFGKSKDSVGKSEIEKLKNEIKKKTQKNKVF
jgi:hypothetical protein